MPLKMGPGSQEGLKKEGQQKRTSTPRKASFCAGQILRGGRAMADNSQMILHGIDMEGLVLGYQLFQYRPTLPNKPVDDTPDKPTYDTLQPSNDGDRTRFGAPRLLTIGERDLLTCPVDKRAGI